MRFVNNRFNAKASDRMPATCPACGRTMKSSSVYGSILPHHMFMGSTCAGSREPGTEKDYDD